MNPRPKHTSTPETHAIALLAGRFAPAIGAADSVLLAGGRIEAIGSARDVAALAPADAERIDLGGRIVTPGLQDGHMHFLSMGIRAARPDLSPCRSLDEALACVHDAAKEQSGGEILIAETWDETRWVRPERPTRDVIDRVAPGRPVVMRRVCGHTAVANSAALRRIAEVWNGGGVDPATGLLLEHPALSMDVMFPPSAVQTDAGFDTAARMCLERGITAGCDFLRPGDPALYARRLAQGELPLRVHGYLVEADAEHDGLASLTAERRSFRLEGIKIFSDGSIGARTAALLAPYDDPPGTEGALLLDVEAIAAWIARAHARRCSLAVHAIGDGAIAAVIDAFSRFDPDECRARRHRVEHLELPRPGDAERLATCGVRPCMQPNFVAEWGFPGGLYERALGTERVRRMNPLASVDRAGCGLFFGSDGMPLSSLYGIRAAMTHPTERERLSAEDALRLSTRAVAEAFATHEVSGSIAAGMDADLCVLPLGFEWERATAATRTDLTIVGGRIAHRGAAFVVPAERSRAA